MADLPLQIRMLHLSDTLVPRSFESRWPGPESFRSLIFASVLGTLFSPAPISGKSPDATILAECSEHSPITFEGVKYEH